MCARTLAERELRGRKPLSTRAATMTFAAAIFAAATSKLQMNGHFSIQIVTFQGKFSIISAFSIENSKVKSA